MVLQRTGGGDSRYAASSSGLAGERPYGQLSVIDISERCLNLTRK